MARRRKNRKKKKKNENTRSAVVTPAGPPDGSAARARRTTLVVAAFLGIGILTAAYLLKRGVAPAAAPRPLNVVVVTADTLRADRLGAYGATSVETPNLDRLAASGVLFENAATAVPITLPAHASIFTGTYPVFHGVRENGGQPLAPANATLAETLQGAGYATGAFVGAFVLDRRFGLDQGFERYADEMGSAERPGGEVLDEALAWMDSVGDRRFFSWIHFFDPHVPYDPPEPFRSRYSPSLEGLYDGEVAYVDDLVGKLLDWLDARGLDESTLVVFVSDHGESLGEHGELTHGFFLYRATMRVPLLLRAPNLGAAGRRVTAQVRTIDIAPTILELLGIEPPAETQGASLVSLASGRDEPSLEAFGESMMPRHYGWSALRSLRNSEYQYIDAPRPELYDVVDDPGETKNLAATRAATVESLRERTRELQSSLAAEMSPEARTAPAPIDPGAVAKLTALGYLASGASPHVEPGTELADPKDKIDVFNRIREAAAAVEAGERERALSLLEAVLAEDPAVVETHNLIGKLQLELGRPDRAVEAYRNALALDRDYVPSILGLAQAYQALGREDDALAGVERVLELAPDAPGAHYLQAVALERRGQLDRAIREYEEELRVSPGDYRAHFDLAKLLGQRGRGAEMLSHLQKSVEANPGFAAGRFYFANALLEAGQPERAAEEAQQGLAAGPEPALAPFGHFILADAYGRLGRNQEAAREMAKAQELQQRVGAPPQ